MQFGIGDQGGATYFPEVAKDLNHANGGESSASGGESSDEESSAYSRSSDEETSTSGDDQLLRVTLDADIDELLGEIAARNDRTSILVCVDEPTVVKYDKCADLSSNCADLGDKLSDMQSKYDDLLSKYNVTFIHN
ncbi:hypothetical protein Hanom_Chr07g00642341 [Helianthus anomalus]